MSDMISMPSSLDHKPQEQNRHNPQKRRRNPCGVAGLAIGIIKRLDALDLKIRIIVARRRSNHIIIVARPGARL